MQNKGKITVRVGRNTPSHKKYVITAKGKKVQIQRVSSAKHSRQEMKKEQRITGKVYVKQSSKARSKKNTVVCRGKKIKKLKLNRRKLKIQERRCYEKVKHTVIINVASEKINVYSVSIKKEKRKERYLQGQKQKVGQINIKKEEKKEKQEKNRKGFVKDAALATARGEVESQNGGIELLHATGTLRTGTQGTVSFVKTAVETGKTAYQSGKETAVFIGNTITKNKEKEQKAKKSELQTAKKDGKRDVSRKVQSEKKMEGVKSREEYTERKNAYRYQKGQEKKNTKKEERKKKDKQRNESIARNRMLTYIQNKTSQNPEKTDSIGNVVKDIVKGKARQLGQKAVAALGKKIVLYLGSALGSLLVILIPIIVIIVFLYSSPLAIFFPSDEKNETIEDVLAGYYTEFCDKVQKEEEADGYDRITVKSSTGETDIEVSKSNYKDVLCVFAEKYGYDLQIADVSKKVKNRLKKVFNDMNYYSTNTATKTKKNKKGEQVQKKIKTITITQKNWKDMVTAYRFDEESTKELKELLAYADEFGIEIEEEEDYSTYAGTDTCIDGKVYDNPKAPVYKGSCAKIAKKTKNYIRPVLKKKGLEPYIDIIVSMVQQESTFGMSDNGNWLQVNGYKGKPGMASVKAGITHFEGLVKKCKSKKITDIKTLVQSYNMGSAYIDFIKRNGGKDKTALQKKFQYKQRADGRYGTRGYSSSVMSRVKGQKPKITSMPLYFQAEPPWKTVRFSTSTIGKSGCGVCSSAMVVSYWTGKTVTPKTLVGFCHKYYVSGKGASWSMIPAVASHYHLKCKSLGTNKKKMVAELKKGHSIIAIMHTGYFTSGGHYIVLRSIDSKGKISINDCGSRRRTARTYNAEFIQSNNPANYWAIYK